MEKMSAVLPEGKVWDNAYDPEEVDPYEEAY